MLQRGLRHGLSIRIMFEQILGDDIDSFIRALSRQNSCHQQLKRRVRNELAVSVGVFLFKAD